MTNYKCTNLKQETKAGEIKKLEDALKKVKGVNKVIAHAKEGSVDIDFTPETPINALKDAARSAGFPLQQ